MTNEFPDVRPDPAAILPMWEDAATIAAFVGWHPAAVTYYRPASEALLTAAGVRPGTHLLDIGTGTGIPALLATEVVGPPGTVVATDPSPGLLAAAEVNARMAGSTNLTFRPAAAEALPFPDAAFDAVVSQLGLMFVADLPRALGEMRRVLRPGGRAAFLAWGPYEQNPHWTAFWEIEERYAAELAAGEPTLPEAVPTEEAAAPDPRGPFRFAAKGTLGEALRSAGFTDVREEIVRFRLSAPTAEPIVQFWLTGNETHDRLPEGRQRALREEALAAYHGFAVDGEVQVPAVFVLGSGAAP